MSYMSYCRFEGTLHELRACLNDVEEHVNEEAQYGVSDSEIEQFKIMVHEFVDFLKDTEILDANGEVDETMLDGVARAMEQGYEEEY